jgi:hypothetical protein
MKFKDKDLSPKIDFVGALAEEEFLQVSVQQQRCPESCVAK